MLLLLGIDVMVTVQQSFSAVTNPVAMVNDHWLVVIFSAVTVHLNQTFQEQVWIPLSEYWIRYTTSCFNLSEMVALLCK